MNFEKDYVMRMIKDLVRAITALLMNKGDASQDNSEKADKIDGDLLLRELKELADKGNINEAENYLLTEIEDHNIEYFRMALSFYDYLNDFDESFLEQHNYTHSEIIEGIKYISEKYGYGEVVRILL